MRDGEALHGCGFDVLIVRCAAGHDDVRGDAALVFANRFKNALALLGAGGAIGVARVAEDDESVEVRESGIGGGNGEVKPRHTTCDRPGKKEADHSDVSDDRTFVHWFLCVLRVKP